jgi:hypothetical protein
VLLAFAVGPLLSDVLDRLSASLIDRKISLLGAEIFVPGVRLTLWLAGLVIVGAGVLAVLSLRAGARVSQDGEPPPGLVTDVARPYSDVQRSHDQPARRQ